MGVQVPASGSWMSPHMHADPTQPQPIQGLQTHSQVEALIQQLESDGMAGVAAAVRASVSQGGEGGAAAGQQAK